MMKTLLTPLLRSNKLPWLALLLLGALWFYALGARTLIPTDEGRYAEMAREMVVSGDWITPRLNGIKYFEKPPLQVWMTALAFKVFGLGEWQARLWTGLCGLFGIALTAWAGRQVFGPRVGNLAGMVLASCFLWSGMSQINTLDMSLSSMMTLALCGLLLAQNQSTSPAQARAWMLASWAGMALAVLSKGLIGIVLPGAVLVLYTLLSRDWAIWKRLALLPGLAMFFAITSPWFVLVSLKNPEFAHFFFIVEHFERFTSPGHMREGAWYYFVPILLLGTVPWVTVLPQSLWHSWQTKTSGFQPQKLLLIWSVFIFVFFSISHSKLPSYILPIFPALALLIGLQLERAGRKTWLITGGLTLLSGALALSLIPGLSRVPGNPADQAMYQAAEPIALVAGLVLFLTGAAVLWLARRAPEKLNAGAPMMLALGALVCELLILLATEPYGIVRAGKGLVPAIQAELTPGVKLYSVGLYDQTLPYYLQRTSTLVLQADELKFGLEQEPHLWMPEIASFYTAWQGPDKMVAVVRDWVLEDMQRQGFKLRIVAQDTRRVIITNALESPPRP